MKHSIHTTSNKEQLKELYTILGEVTKEIQKHQDDAAPVPEALFEKLHSILKKVVALEHK